MKNVNPVPPFARDHLTSSHGAPAAAPDFVWTPPGEKPTNPKDAVGIKKAPLSTVSTAVLTEVGLGMMEGALKYGRHNYRAIGVRASVYFDATIRHLFQWWEGEDIDPDSDLSHVTKAICSLVVLRDAMIQDKFTDDRPPQSKVDWKALNEHAAKLLEKFPEPKSAYTAKPQEKLPGR